MPWNRVLSSYVYHDMKLLKETIQETIYKLNEPLTIPEVSDELIIKAEKCVELAKEKFKIWNFIMKVYIQV